VCRTTIEEGLESSQPALLVRNLSLSMVEGTVCTVHRISIDKKKEDHTFRRRWKRFYPHYTLI
jgi:hypothetical protein